MQAKRVSIVPANVDHSSFLARVVLDASRSQLDRGPFDIALRLDELEVLDILEWMVLSDLITNCHFSKFFVAEADGKPIGALAGFDPGDPDLFPLGAALSDAYCSLGYRESELPAVVERVHVLGRCFPPASPGTWIVEWVAVDAVYRNRGVCGQLLREVLAAGADQGLRKAQISTYIGNVGATTAYERAGFEIDAVRRDPGFEALLGIPGMLTMQRDLPTRGVLSTLKKLGSVPLVFEASYPLSTMPIPW